MVPIMEGFPHFSCWFTGGSLNRCGYCGKPTSEPSTRTGLFWALPDERTQTSPRHQDFRSEEAAKA